MNAGLCMIIPAARKTDGIDLVTDSLVPDDSVVRIAPDDMTKQLAERIHAFVTNPDQINQYQRSMKMAASTFIKNWDDRIAEEFELLELAGRS